MLSYAGETVERPLDLLASLDEESVGVKVAAGASVSLSVLRDGEMIRISLVPEVASAPVG
jgi:hypothetical protein